MSKLGLASLVALGVLVGPSSAQAKTWVDAGRTVAVDPDRGVDSRVDYASLVRLGPWDDRNYALTLEDLRVLAPNEAELGDPVPAFFRVGMRKAWPELLRSGPAQYPRSALQIFQLMFGGYLVDDRLYRKARREGAEFAVVLEDGVDAATFSSSSSLGEEARVTSPQGAAESAIKVNPMDPARVIAGTNGPGSGQKMHYSLDGGSTWTETILPLGNTCCDPAVDWSSDGQFAYATTLGACSFFGCGVWFYRSDDGGVTWDGLDNVTPGDPRREITNGGSDKEFIHVDKHPSSPHKDNVYVTWHDSNIMKFAVSSDFGDTFTKQSFSSASEDRGIGSDITTDAGGNVYYFWPAFNSRTIRMRKSSDGGSTFASTVVVASTQGSFDFPIPSMETRRVFIYVSADADLSDGPYQGSVYAAWTDTTGPESGSPSDNHARIQVAYSRDGGSTWNTSTPHATSDASSVDRWHQWLAVGEDGTVHVIYYDTRRDGSRSSVDVFYSYSTNGAQSWSDPQLVTSELSPNISDGFEFGDYNGLDIVMSDLVSIFTDNRDESGGASESVDVYAAGIEPGMAPYCGNSTLEPGESCDGAILGGQTCSDFGCSGGSLDCRSDCGGFNLSSCAGCPGPGRVPDGDFTAGGPLRVDRAGGNVTLTWSGVCGDGDDYAVYEGLLGDPNSLDPRLCSTGGATSVTLEPSSGNRFYVVVATDGGSEGSYGLTSADDERAPAAEACLPQQIGSCP